MVRIATEQVISLPKAADMIGVSWRTIRNWIDNGTLDASYFGGTLRTTVEALERMQRPAQGERRASRPVESNWRSELSEQHGMVCQ